MTIGNSLSSASSSYSSSNVHSQSSASSIASSQNFSNVQSQMSTSFMILMDDNQDNNIDKSEFQNVIDSLSDSKNSSANNILDMLDTNKNGMMSSDELLSALKQSQTSTDTSAQQVSTKNSIETMQSTLLQKILASYGSSDLAMSSSASLTA